MKRKHICDKVPCIRARRHSILSLTHSLSHSLLSLHTLHMYLSSHTFCRYYGGRCAELLCRNRALDKPYPGGSQGVLSIFYDERSKQEELYIRTTTSSSPYCALFFQLNFYVTPSVSSAPTNPKLDTKTLPLPHC